MVKGPSNSNRRSLVSLFGQSPSVPPSSGGSFNLPGDEKIVTVVDNPTLYPSNADIVFLGKVTNSPAPGQIGQYFGSDTVKAGRYTTQAPRGHYILDPWRLDRQLASGLDLEQNFITARPSAVGFYAGRAWWGGVRDDKYVGTVFFTQLLDTDDKIGKCYQENDPTAEQISDLLDTDGGFIPIPECGHILKLTAFNDVLIVFASNGIWAIGSDVGFSATSYSTRKLTNIGVISPESIVEAENFIFFWSDSGIYRLEPDNITGYLSPTNITINTIQTFYNELPSIARLQVYGVYDNTEKRVWWYYNPNPDWDGGDPGGEGGGVPGNYPTRYTHALVFDVTLEAFSPHKFSESDYNYVVAAAMSATNTRELERNAIKIGSLVVCVGTDEVITSSPTASTAQQTQKVLVVNTEDFNISFGDYTSLTFSDFAGWTDASGAEPYSSYMDTGFQINGSIKNDQQFVYVIPAFNRTEKSYVVSGGDATWQNQSACRMFSKWDWTSTSSSNKWSSAEDAYRLTEPVDFSTVDGTYNYVGGQEVVNNKLKVRGQGTSLQLRFNSQSGKDMQLLGFQYVAEQTTDA